MTFTPHPCPFDPARPEGETQAKFALIECDDEDMYEYWRLAVETSQFIGSLEHKVMRPLRPRWFEEDRASSALAKLEQLSEFGRNPDVSARWEDWGKKFQILQDRSPRYRLIDLISWISETHSYCSWPKRWERQVYEWAMFSTDEDECPFTDNRNVIDAGYRLRLRDTIIEAGGFLYSCEETNQPVFVPTDELDAIWKHQEHLADIDRNKSFGFFYDAGRPGVQMRQPTEEEEQMLAAIQNKAARKNGPTNRLLTRLRQLAKNLRP